MQCCMSRCKLSELAASGGRGYEESMDAELQEVFNFAISKGVTLFDTADSYGVALTQFCPTNIPLI